MIELIFTIETFGSLIFQEGIRSVLILSDFFDQPRMEWMLTKFVHFLEVIYVIIRKYNLLHK